MTKRDLKVLIQILKKNGEYECAKVFENDLMEMENECTDNSSAD